MPGSWPAQKQTRGTDGWGSLSDLTGLSWVGKEQQALERGAISGRLEAILRFSRNETGRRLTLTLAVP